MGASVAAALLAAASVTEVRAVSLDLTAGTTSGTINGGFFIRSDAASTGTGVIESFVRLTTTGRNTSEEGYNADARPVMPDVNTSPQFTRDIQLSVVPVVVNPDGQVGSYYEFLLDINQNNNEPLLSLDALQIYTRGTALAAAATLADLTGSGASLRYDLDTGVDSEILLNYSLNAGSGSGDLLAYIPVTAFGGAIPTDYVYLYSQFGAKGGDYEANAGFEEWATRDLTTTQVPDAGTTAALLGSALLALSVLRRRWKA